jgi:hypothetical protein
MSPPAITFVESRVFTRRVHALNLEDALHLLQLELALRPTAGVVDPGTGGLRKIRIADPGRGKGKRSGARVHYLWVPALSTVHLIFVYSKDESDTLTPEQKRSLRAVARSIGAMDES